MGKKASSMKAALPLSFSRLNPRAKGAFDKSSTQG